MSKNGKRTGGRVREAVARRVAGRGRVDYARLDATTDEEIERQAREDGEPRQGADFWKGAVLVEPGFKTAISLRVDADVLEWFRAQGPGYQSRMNQVLRTWYEYHRGGARAAGRGRPRR